jgi:hypothetical protein
LKYGRFLDADRWAQRAVDFGLTHNVLFAQALGLEYLGEDAIQSGDFVAGIEYAETEPIGELRLASLLKGSFAVLKAYQASDYRSRSVSDRYGAPAQAGSGIDRMDPQRLLDEALQSALDNYQAGETSDLPYSRFEGRRCLAVVRFRRGEFDGAERLCAAASELVSETESRLSRLLLGPLYIEKLLAAGLRAEAEGKPDEAAAKRGLAAEHLANYQEIVADCQSPRFTREAARLADLIAFAN